MTVQLLGQAQDGSSPFESTCTERRGGLLCLGVSRYQLGRNAARVEAKDAALDALAAAIASEIRTPIFQTQVRPLFEKGRSALLAAGALSGHEHARVERDLERRIALARSRSADAMLRFAQIIFRQSPMIHWEENTDHNKPEFRYYQHIEIDAAMRRSLVELFSKESQSAKGGSLPAFPLLAWTYPDMRGQEQLRWTNSGGTRGVAVLTDTKGRSLVPDLAYVQSLVDSSIGSKRGRDPFADANDPLSHLALDRGSE